MAPQDVTVGLHDVDFHDFIIQNMPMRGFDINFWIAVFTCIFLFIFVVTLAKLFKFNPVFILLISVGLAWLALNLWEKRLLRNHSSETSLVYCEWEDRINDSDFDADQVSTILDLAELGLSLNQAIGKSFTFHAEASLNEPDIFFDGIIVRDNSDRIVIRASKTLPIKFERT